MTITTEDNKTFSETHLNVWAKNLIQEYSPQIDYFLNNGSQVEQKLARKVVELAGVKK